MITSSLMTFLLAVVSAQDVAVPLKVGDQDGVWFTLEEANRLNKVDLLEPLRLEQIEKLEALNTLQEARIKELEEANAKPCKGPVIWPWVVGLTATAFALGVLATLGAAN